MRKCVFVVLFTLLVSAVKSQNLNVEGVAPELYFNHTVAPKENYYSIGRLYNQAPKLIASFNNLVMEKGLSIGQQIKIPLTAQNFTTEANAGVSPLTHIVSKSETLFRIGANHQVDVQLLKQWNNLGSDNISVGTPLVVGYLKTTAQTQIANVAPAAPAPTPQPTGKKEPVTPAVETKPAPNAATNEPFGSITTPNGDTALQIITSESAAPKPVNKPVPAADTFAKQPAAEVPAKVKKENEPVIKTATPVTKAETPVAATKTVAAPTVAEQGSFVDIFNRNAGKKNLSTKTGEAATFKSTSGWQDKKYYVLINDITPGSIVKIKSGADKTVYAKVLGSMPEMKENNGLLLRVSNSAASALGIFDPKFTVEINYY